MYKYDGCCLRGIYLKNGYEVHKTQYGEGVSVHDVDGLHKAIGTHLVRNKSYLSGAEVRFLRKELGLSQVQLAKLLGVTENSVRGWENHRSKITKPAERLLRVLYLEFVCPCSKIKELVERINDLNRDQHHSMEFEESKSGWGMAA